MSKPILIITEGYDKSEAREGKPLTGIYGPLWQWLRAQSGLLTSDYQSVALFDTEVKRPFKGNKKLSDRHNNTLWEYSANHKGFTESGHDAKTTFNRVISDWLCHAPPNAVLVPMGEAAFYALTGKIGYRKYRGTPIRADQGRTIIPTFQPWQVSERGEFLMRYAVSADLQKAKRFSQGAKIPEPELILPRYGTKELDRAM